LDEAKENWMGAILKFLIKYNRSLGYSSTLEVKERE